MGDAISCSQTSYTCLPETEDSSLLRKKSLAVPSISHEWSHHVHFTNRAMNEREREYEIGSQIKYQCWSDPTVLGQ